MKLWVLLAILMLSSQIAYATPIPIEEEFIVAQQLQVDSSLDAFVLDVFRTTGLLDAGATFHYTGAFSIAQDFDGEFSGSYAGTLVGLYFGEIVMIDLSAEMETLADAASTKTWKLKSKEREGTRKHRDEGTLSVVGGRKHLEEDITIGDQTLKIEGDLEQTKTKDQMLVSTGTISVGGEEEFVSITLKQNDKNPTFVSLIASKNVILQNMGDARIIRNTNGTVEGSTDFDVSVTTIPEPSSGALLATGVLMCLGCWLCRSSNS